MSIFLSSWCEGGWWAAYMTPSTSKKHRLTLTLITGDAAQNAVMMLPIQKIKINEMLK